MKNHSFVPDLFNNSVDSVQRTILNDSYVNQSLELTGGEDC